MGITQPEIMLPTGNKFSPDGLDDLVLFIPETEEEKRGLYSMLEEYTRISAGKKAVKKDLDPYDEFSFEEEGYPYAIFGLKRGEDVIGMGTVEVVKITDIICGKRAKEKGLDTSKLSGEQVGMLFYMASNDPHDFSTLVKVCDAGNQLARAMANPEKYVATFTESRGLEIDAAEEAGYDMYTPDEFFETPSRTTNGATTDLCLMVREAGDLIKMPMNSQEAALFAAMQRTYFKQNITPYFNIARQAIK